jgi:excisionase family DNA binding protein
LRIDGAKPVKPSPPESERFVDAEYVATMLGVHVEWVYDRAKQGVLPSYQLGRLRRFDPLEIRAVVRAWKTSSGVPRLEGGS